MATVTEPKTSEEVLREIESSLDDMALSAKAEYRTAVISGAEGKFIPGLPAILAAASEPFDNYKADVRKAVARTQALLDIKRSADQMSEAEALHRQYIVDYNAFVAFETELKQQIETRRREISSKFSEYNSKKQGALELKKNAISVLGSTADPSIVPRLLELDKEKAEINERIKGLNASLLHRIVDKWHRVIETKPERRKIIDRDLATENRRLSEIQSETDELHARINDPAWW